MLVRNMSRNSFDPRALAHEKTAICLIVPDEKTTYHFIATTFIKQCYETLVNEAQSREDLQLPVRVNFVLDEFTNIPAIPDMPSMITAARSRNMRFFPVVQSMHQLKQKYGDETQTIRNDLAACTTLLVATKAPGSEDEEYDVEFVTAVCLVPGLEAFAEKLVERAEEESEEEEESETW